MNRRAELTTLQEDVLVLVVDAQTEIVASSRTNDQPTIRRNLAVLLQGARALDLPIVVTGVPLGAGSEPIIIEELNEQRFFKRSSVSALDDPILAEHLQKSGTK